MIPAAPDATPFGFTADEQKLYDKLVPAIPDEVVAQLLREYGCWEQKDDLLQEAYIGTARGVRTFDASKGGELRTWVFFSALRAAQTLLRGEKRQSRVVQAMWSAAMEHCMQLVGSFDSWNDTPEMNRAALTQHRSAIAAAAYVGIATVEPSTGGIEDIVLNEAARHCAEGLRQILGDLSARRFRLLHLHFGHNRSVKEAATLVGERGYRAELVEFHRVIKLVSARLHGLQIDELPPFPPELGGTLLAELDEP